MAEIINLNRARKARAAAEKKATARANRSRHGRTKADVSLSEAQESRRNDQLDAHRIERDDETDPAEGA